MNGFSRESTKGLPLRERKRIKLRHTILDTALRLFLTQGYERTTLEQICDEAETSLRTMLRHFGTKEELAIGRELEQYEHAVDDFAHLDPTRPVILRWREMLEVASSRSLSEALLDQMRLFETVPAIAARVAALQVRYEDLLADAFAREAKIDPHDDMYGRLLAGMLIAGNRAAARKWLANEGKLNLARLRTDVVDWALENFPKRS